jgi:hypothetical protein
MNGAGWIGDIVDLGEITTRSTLAAGFRVALNLLNLQVVTGNGSR